MTTVESNPTSAVETPGAGSGEGAKSVIYGRITV